MKGYLLGIDVGTTNTKLCLINARTGEQMYTAYREHEIIHVMPGYAEHDAQKLWYGEMKALIGEMFRSTDVLNREIQAIGISAIYPVIVPVDGDGRALRNAILYGIDTRAVDEIVELQQTLTDECSIRKNGNRLNTQSIAPKILWLKKNEPELFARTKYFMFATSYLVFKLTGACVVDHGSACLGGLPYDMENNGWDTKTLEVLEIQIQQLPRLLYSYEIAGEVTKEAARDLGLAEGTPVIAGTGDHIAEVFAIGGIRKNTAIISYGTTFGMDLCTEKKQYYPGLQMSRSCFEHLYLTGGGMANGGSVTKWFRDLCHKPFPALDGWAGEIRPGSDALIALPYFNGERCPFYDPYAKGALFGLRLEHTQKHIYRALLESVAYGIRHVMDTIKAAGFVYDDILAVGGGTASDIWMQIISDVCGVCQKVLPGRKDSAYGAALLAGYGTGIPVDAFLYPTGFVKEVWPNADNRDVYDHLYLKYRQLYETTKNIIIQGG